MRVLLTYHSNAIEGNTLSLYETRMVIEEGVTISGQPLRYYLEARNHADNTAYAAEKALRDFGEKVPAEVKSDIEAKVADVRGKAQGEDVAAIKSATEALGQAIQKIGAAVYEQAGPQAGEATGQPSGEPGSSGPNDNPGSGPDVVEGEVKD